MKLDEMKYSAVYTDSAKYNDYSTTLVISHDGKEIAHHEDDGEPEDQSFYGDWSWVKEELLRAYSLGFKDGKADKEDRRRCENCKHFTPASGGVGGWCDWNDCGCNETFYCQGFEEKEEA